MNTDKLTQKSLEALQNAQSLAVRFGHQAVDSDHLLSALLEQTDGIVPRLMNKIGLEPARLAEATKSSLSKKPRVSGGDPNRVYVTRELTQLLATAEEAAKQLTDDYVSVEHLVLAMLRTSGPAKTILEGLGVNEADFLTALKDVRGNQRVTSATPEATYDALAKYGPDLVERARSGTMDPVIGRDGEIRRVVRILSRKTKNNPVLIGEPGVGKTAIAEGLAQRIVSGDVPNWMEGHTVFALDMGSLISERSTEGSSKSASRPCSRR